MQYLYERVPTVEKWRCERREKNNNNRRLHLYANTHTGRETERRTKTISDLSAGSG